MARAVVVLSPLRGHRWGHVDLCCLDSAENRVKSFPELTIPPFLIVAWAEMSFGCHLADH